MSRLYLFIVLQCLITIQVFAQSGDSPENNSIQPISSETNKQEISPEDKWVFDKEIDNVEFYYQIGKCGNNQAVFIKIVNNNKYAIQANWKELFYDKLLKEEVEGAFGGKSIRMNAESLILGECNNTENTECVTFASKVTLTHLAEITAFKFKDVSIKAIN